MADQGTGFVFSDDDKKQLASPAATPASGGFTFSDADKKQYGPPPTSQANVDNANKSSVSLKGSGDTLGRELSSTWQNIAGIPSGVYHAFTDQPTQEEAAQLGGEPSDLQLARHVGLLGGYRMIAEPLRTAEDWYENAAKGKVPNATDQALSVAPEAMGAGAATALLSGPGGALDTGIKLKSGANPAETLTAVRPKPTISSPNAGPNATTWAANRVGETVPAAVSKAATTIERVSTPANVGKAVGGSIGGKVGGVEGAGWGALAGDQAARILFPNAEKPLINLPSWKNLGAKPTPTPAPITGEQLEFPATVNGPLFGNTFEEPMPKAAPAAESPAAPAPKAPSVEDLANQVTGWKPLERNVPLRQQIKTEAPPITYRLDSNGVTLAKTPDSPAEVSVPDRLTGADRDAYVRDKVKLQTDFSAQRNGGAPNLTPTETDPIKVKYPDAAERQNVRNLGERMYEETKGDTDTMSAVKKLGRVELRQALINAGEDMKDMTVSDSKFAGKGSIGREAAFNKLLDLGFTPQEIIEMSKPPAKP